MKLLSTSILVLLAASVYAQNEQQFDTIFKNASYVDFEAYMTLAAEAQEHRNDRLVSFEEFKEMSQESNTIILDTRSKEMYDRSHIKGAVHLNFADFNMWSLAKIVPDTNTPILIYCNNNFDYPTIPMDALNLAIADYSDLTYVSKGVVPRIPLTIEFASLSASSEETWGDQYRVPIENAEEEEVTIPDSFGTSMVSGATNAKARLEAKQKKEREEPAAIEASKRERTSQPKAFPLTMALNIPTYINLYGYGYKNVYELGDLISVYSSKIEFEGTDHQQANNELNDLEQPLYSTTTITQNQQNETF